MTVAIVCVSVVVLVLGVMAIAARAPSPNRPGLLAERAHSEVLVSLKSGAAFRGVLYAEDDLTVVLRNASQADPRTDGGFITADGEVLILKADIDFCQFP